MNLDPFGHIEVARFYQNHARKRGWIDRVEEIEEWIKKMQKSELEYWMKLREVNRPGDGK